jgi:DNA repair exonuclease SbcCD ATPase subunit
MSGPREVLRSEAIAEEIKVAEQRREELQERVETLGAEIEEQREQLGRAMAGVDSEGSVQNIRVALRDAEDELDASERGLGYLADEIQKLTAAKRAAQGQEAKAASDDALSVAVTAIDELAGELRSCLETLVPRIEPAYAATLDSVGADRRATKLTGARLPATSRVHERGWAMHPLLETVTAALRRYAEEAPAAAADAR